MSAPVSELMSVNDYFDSIGVRGYLLDKVNFSAVINQAQKLSFKFDYLVLEDGSFLMERNGWKEALSAV